MGILPGGRNINYNSSKKIKMTKLFTNSVSNTMERIVKNLSKTNWFSKIKFFITGGKWFSHYVEIHYSNPSTVEQILKEAGVQFTRIEIGSAPSTVYFCFDEIAVTHMRLIQ